MYDTVHIYTPALVSGLLTTLAYFAIGTVGSMLLALPVALGARSANRLVRWPVISYIEIFRNTPLLVQLFWLHYALPILTGVSTTAQQTAAIALVLVMTAYMAEVYRAGIGGVPRGLFEAGLALGLGRNKCWAFIVIPLALRIAFPAISNTLVSLLKATSVLSILAVPELLRTTTRISDYTSMPILFYSLTAILYIVMAVLLSIIFGYIEQRMAIKAGI